MANVLFSRTSDPSSKPITDGQLIFDTSGNGKMYLDVGSERMEMGGARTIDPVLNSSSENPIQNKAVAGVMLDNMTDVNAVTGSGFLPDALAIKELDTDLQGQINTLNSNLDTFKNKTSIESYKFNTSSDVERDSYTVQHTGWAMLYYRFNQSEYSQFSLFINGANVFGNNITNGNSKFDVSGAIPLYLQKGDVVIIEYYLTFRMHSIELRVRY